MKFIKLGIISLIGIALILPVSVLALDTGWKSPTASGEVYNNWTNPANAYSSNDIYAVDGYNELQDYYNFTFNVPTGSIIDGIEVSAEGNISQGDHATTYVELSSDGTNWTAILEAPFFSSAIDEIVIWGGSTNLWGRSWIDTELANSEFRLRISVQSIGHILNVDHIQTKVYYTEVSVPVCGNDIKETGEVCDGTDLVGETCVSQGFQSGTLACAVGCGSFDTSGCSYVAPDGHIIPMGIDFPSNTMAYVGDLFIDLFPYLGILIGLPLAFWIIKSVIQTAKNKKKGQKFN